MGVCANCGHELGDGRFCSNCGHPLDAPSTPPPSTPPPTTPPPTTPPPTTPPPTTPPAPHAGQPPPPPRFPLFADEAEPEVHSEAYGVPESSTHRRHQRPVWPFVVAAVTLVLVIGVLAGVALLADDGSGSAGTGSPTTSGPGQDHSSAASGDGGNLAADATVEVPATAPPNQDVSGKPTTYDGTNMLDGVPETCWRMAGDGTGKEITVTLAGKTHLTRVGLINGYAKTAQDAHGDDVDWYHGNRRVLTVDWVFDDGTTVTQDFSDTVAVQSMDVDVTTTTVVIRLVSVSPPGTGRAARDYTAISDLSFVGS